MSITKNSYPHINMDNRPCDLINIWPTGFAEDIHRKIWISSNPFYSLSQILYGCVELVVFFHFFLYRGAGVHDCCMVTAEAASDIRKGYVCKSPAEIHCYLARDYKVAGSFLGEKCLNLDFEVLCHDFLNQLNGDFHGFRRRVDVLHGFRDYFRCYRLIAEGRKGADACKGALKLTDVAVDAAGDVVKNLVRRVNVFENCLFLQDCDSRFKVRCLNIRDESPFKA